MFKQTDTAAETAKHQKAEAAILNNPALNKSDKMRALLAGGKYTLTEIARMLDASVGHVQQVRANMDDGPAVSRAEPVMGNSTTRVLPGPKPQKPETPAYVPFDSPQQWVSKPAVFDRWVSRVDGLDVTVRESLRVANKGRIERLLALGFGYDQAANYLQTRSTEKQRESAFIGNKKTIRASHIMLAANLTRPLQRNMLRGLKLNSFEAGTANQAAGFVWSEDSDLVDDITYVAPIRQDPYLRMTQREVDYVRPPYSGPVSLAQYDQLDNRVDNADLFNSFPELARSEETKWYKYRNYLRDIDFESPKPIICKIGNVLTYSTVNAQELKMPISDNLNAYLILGYRPSQIAAAMKEKGSVVLPPEKIWERYIDCRVTILLSQLLRDESAPLPIELAIQVIDACCLSGQLAPYQVVALRSHQLLPAKKRSELLAALQKAGRITN